MYRFTTMKNGEPILILLSATECLMFGKDRKRWRINGSPIGSQTIAGEAINKFYEYEELEERGLLLKIPCRIGDKIYKIWSCGKNGKSIAEFEVNHIDIDDMKDIKFYAISTKKGSFTQRTFSASDIGKSIFLTIEEAKKELDKNER